MGSIDYNLFRCETIEQHKIKCWLAEEGVVREDIARVEFPDRNMVRVTNPAGQYMELRLRDGAVVIC